MPSNGGAAVHIPVATSCKNPAPLPIKGLWGCCTAAAAPSSHVLQSTLQLAIMC